MLTGGSIFSAEKDSTTTVPATVSFAGVEDPIAIDRLNPTDAKTKDPAAPANMRKAGMPLTIDYASPWRFDTQKVSLMVGLIRLSAMYLQEIRLLITYR
ncbi:hypothetical protein WCO01_02130 [Weissella confusa]|nr:hypothetical protein WCO01_02130 [Weissella confusa]